MPAPFDLLMATAVDGGSTFSSPADLSNQLHRWDASNLNLYSSTEAIGAYDQVGSADWEEVSGPDANSAEYTASNSTLGGQPSVRHPAAGAREWSVTLPSISPGYTIWFIGYFDGTPSGEVLSEAFSASVDNRIAVNVNGTWEVGGDSVSYCVGSDMTPRSTRPYLCVAYMLNGSASIEVNGYTITLDDQNSGTTALSFLYMGHDGGVQFVWTQIGIVSGDMSASDRSNLLAWAIANCGVAAWEPGDLPPPGWWRADLGHAFADTDPVSSIANQGSLGWALGQGTGTYQPTYDASHASFNGQAVLAYDGSDALYLATENWELSSESSDAVFLIVARCADNNATQVLLQTSANTGGGLRFRIGTGTGTTDADWTQQGGATTLTDTGAAATQNAVFVYASVLTGAVTTSPDSGQIFLNGSGGSASTADLSAAVANASTRSFILGSNSTTGGSFNGEIAEVLYIKRVLTSAEKTALVSYLNARYGLALSAVM